MEVAFVIDDPLYPDVVDENGMPWTETTKGGPGSGDFGHAGRPGKVGGSGSNAYQRIVGRVEAGIEPMVEVDGLKIPSHFVLDDINEMDMSLSSYFVSPSGKIIGIRHGWASHMEMALLIQGLNPGKLPVVEIKWGSPGEVAVKGLEQLGFLRVYVDKSSVNIETNDKISTRFLKVVQALYDSYLLPHHPQIYLSSAVPRSEGGGTVSASLGDFLAAKYVVDNTLKEASGKTLPSLKGGPGSGFFGHAGRPGKVGGSANEGKFQAGQVKPGVAVKPGGMSQQEIMKLVTDKLGEYPIVIGSEKLRELDKGLLDGSTDKLIVTSSEGLDLPMKGDEHYYGLKHEDQKIMGCSYKVRQVVKNAIVTELSQRTGIDYGAVDAMIDTWSNTSNDTDGLSLSMQQAVSEVFGGGVSDWQEEQIGDYSRKSMTDYAIASSRLTDTMDDLSSLTNLVDEPKHFKTNLDYVMKNFVYSRYSGTNGISRFTSDEIKTYINKMKRDMAKKNIAAYRKDLADFKAEAQKRLKYRGIVPQEDEHKLVQAMYDVTQEQFKAMGYAPDDKITLFRGAKRPDWKVNPIDYGKKIRYAGNAAESWTIFPSIATRFGNAVVSMQVPVHSVLATFRTGWGCTPEAEVTILGRENRQATYLFDHA